MKAKKKPVDVKDAASLGVSTVVKAKVVSSCRRRRGRGKIICGDDVAVKAAELARLLREEAK